MMGTIRKLNFQDPSPLDKAPTPHKHQPIDASSPHPRSLATFANSFLILFSPWLFVRSVSAIIRFPCIKFCAEADHVLNS